MTTDLHLPDNTTDTDTEYKIAIDEGFQNVERTAWSFAPHPASPTPNMTVDLNPGAIWNAGTLTEKAQQSTTTFVAPVTNPRIDRIVVDETTGTYSIVAGTEAASPTAPEIPAEKFPVCQILFLTTSTSIGYVATTTVAAIFDERVSFIPASSGGGLTSGTAVATTSGTSIDFTSIPAGTKAIYISLNSVSAVGISPYIVQIGDSGGVETSGYQSGVTLTVGTFNRMSRNTDGFALLPVGGVADIGTYSGVLVLTLVDPATFTWAASWGGARCDSLGNSAISGGDKSLSAELDRIRLTTVGGSNTFNGGKMNILYE